MRPVKRIEILTGMQEFPMVERVLEDHGIAGYMAFQVFQGKGNRQLNSFDPLTGQAQSLLVKTTCPAEAVDDLVKALRPILSRYDGACIVYDAQVMILHHEFDARGAAAVLVDEE